MTTCSMNSNGDWQLAVALHLRQPVFKTETGGRSQALRSYYLDRGYVNFKIDSASHDHAGQEGHPITINISSAVGTQS